MDVKTYQSIQYLALQAVEKPDYEANYRRVCRFYSEKFNTPLHIVENELTEIEVWTHYFESVWGELYGNLENEEVAKQYDRIRTTILHGQEALPETELEDEEWVKEMLDEISTSVTDTVSRTVTEAEKMLQDDLWGADKFVEGEEVPSWNEDET